MSNSVIKCKKCGEYKTEDHFITTRWGHMTVCKSCWAVGVAAGRRLAREKKMSSVLVVRSSTTTASDFKGVTSEKFNGISSRELLLELQGRGYKWSDMYVERTKIVKCHVKL